jgi:ABC-type glycerol-3-phosphate transport system permease component
VSRKRILYHVFIYSLAFLICCFSVIPVLWSLSTSLKPETAIFAQPPQWIPSQVSFEHYRAVLNDPRMMRYFLNSFVTAAMSTVAALIVGVLGAYGFSRFKFPGSGAIMISILLTRMLPRVALVVPFFITLQRIHLYNTRPGLTLVFLIITMPLSIWLLKGFFDGVPLEIEEAAIVDGCSVLGVLWRIVIPMTLPAIGAVGMYVFITAWNEFLFALTMTKGLPLRTISVGLAFFIDEFGIRWGSLMAASIMMSIPAVIVFTLFQKSLVRGLSEGAVKG